MINSIKRSIMKKLFFIGLMMISGLVSLTAQKYFTREGKISFFSEASVENIEAHNRSATSVLDTESGRLEFAVLIKGFQFEKALMQEHFNENYMESDEYPKATFKGQLGDPSAINWSQDGTYNVKVVGDMTIHGVTRSISAPGTITIAGDEISAESTFQVAVADYDIEIPSVVQDNIAKMISIAVNVDYQPFNN